MGKLASIVVVTCNRLKFTRLTLESILKNTLYPDYELIILDNGSTDNTVNYLKELAKTFPQVKVTYYQKNTGKGKAANAGFAMSKGEYIIGLDNDVIVPEGWLTTMVRALDTVPNIGWLCINLKNLAHEPGFFSPKYERRFGDITIQETPSVGGQCVAMPRSTYQKLGGYFSDIYYGLEDADYHVRARNLGLLTGYLMNVVGYHLGGTPEEASLYPDYQQYKFSTIRGIQHHDFSLATSNFFASHGAEGTVAYLTSPEVLRQGRLIKGNGPAVYLLFKGVKHAIPSIEVFDRLQLRWENVQYVPDEEIAQIPEGIPLFLE